MTQNTKEQDLAKRLTETDKTVLVSIVDHGSLNLHDLREKTRLSPEKIQRSLKRLQDFGLIEKGSFS